MQVLSGGLFTDAPSTINWISAFREFNRYMAIFRKFFKSKRKCKCLIISDLLFWLLQRLFAQFESFSSECIIPLDFNEILSVRYMFQLRCKVTHFSRKTCRMSYFYISCHSLSDTQQFRFDINRAVSFLFIYCVWWFSLRLYILNVAI